MIGRAFRTGYASSILDTRSNGEGPGCHRLELPRQPRSSLQPARPVGGRGAQDPRRDHALLRQVFECELVCRESEQDGVDDEFENIYVCAFLLFRVGDPADSPRLYRAKFGTRDFDLATGFDAQAIFGAGRSETLQWLRANGFTEEERRLTEWLASSEASTIEEWSERTRRYYYSPTGELLLDAL